MQIKGFDHLKGHFNTHNLFTHKKIYFGEYKNMLFSLRLFTTNPLRGFRPHPQPPKKLGSSHQRFAVTPEKSLR